MLVLMQLEWKGTKAFTDNIHVKLYNLPIGDDYFIEIGAFEFMCQWNLGIFVTVSACVSV